ncbi:MAG: diacylglycerol kinase [Fimbriimonadaceae bacterium]|nr:diacylglycerol kinase [Fimbriimonadaceae bacterium]QYK56195.1 MAG: diacylglycerol kinase [Fimbriimonadaceae bacterium]
MATRDITGPFRVAFSGIVHTFRTQKHMRIHLFVTLITVLGALILNLRIREILVLMFMITFVLVAEMFNSAIEATVDLVSPNYHPLAKFAKDIAAGAVLVTTIMAIIVGSMIAVGDDQWERIRISLTAESIGAPIIWRLIAGVFLVFIIVVIGKGLGKHGQVLQGGLVSGHSALGFFFATCVFFLTDNLAVSAIAILLAAVIAQSRWEAKFHSLFELSLGATVGVILGILLFGITPK